MISTLKEALSFLKTMKPAAKSKGSLSDSLLGKYAGIVPEGKTSSEFVREQRSTSYGKVKK